MRCEGNIAGTFSDFIRQDGALNALFSINARSQIGKAVRDMSCMYAMKDFQCEPHHQHNHFAERRIQEGEMISSNLLDCTQSSSSLWLLFVQYVVHLLNIWSSESLQCISPIEAATGQRQDMYVLMAFHRYEPVYFKLVKSSSTIPAFQSESQEGFSRIVGIDERKGDRLSFLVLDSVTT
jgi:hypothetical protein